MINYNIMYNDTFEKLLDHSRYVDLLKITSKTPQLTIVSSFDYVFNNTANNTVSNDMVDILLEAKLTYNDIVDMFKSNVNVVHNNDVECYKRLKDTLHPVIVSFYNNVKDNVNTQLNTQDNITLCGILEVISNGAKSIGLSPEMSDLNKVINKYIKLRYGVSLIDETMVEHLPNDDVNTYMIDLVALDTAINGNNVVGSIESIVKTIHTNITNTYVNLNRFKYNKCVI